MNFDTDVLQNNRAKEEFMRMRVGGLLEAGRGTLLEAGRAIGLVFLCFFTLVFFWLIRDRLRLRMKVSTIFSFSTFHAAQGTPNRPAMPVRVEHVCTANVMPPTWTLTQNLTNRSLILTHATQPCT